MEIGITTYSRPIILYRCLENIRQYHPNVKIIVFDDNSPEVELSQKTLNDFGVMYKKWEKTIGPEGNNQRFLEHFNRYKVDRWLLLDDDITFNAPFLELAETKFDEGFEHLYIRTAREDRIQFVGAFIGGTQKLLDKIGGFNIERFSGYGGGHVDWQFRAINNKIATEIKIDYNLQETKTANKQLKNEWELRPKDFRFKDLGRIDNKKYIKII